MECVHVAKYTSVHYFRRLHVHIPYLYNANVNILLYIILGGYMYTTPYLYNANVNILLYIILGGYMYTFHIYTMLYLHWH
jgi:hypothetical protein